MWMIFRTRKDIEREQALIKKDKAIERIKATVVERVKTANEAVDNLDTLIDKHGVSGVIYFSTGKGKR